MVAPTREAVAEQASNTARGTADALGGSWMTTARVDSLVPGLHGAAGLTEARRSGCALHL